MFSAGEIPLTWLKLNLGDVVNYGLAQKAEPFEINDDVWVLELEDIEKNSSRILHKIKFSQRKSKSTKNKFEAGDVLYGKLRPYLNKVAFADEAGVCTTEIVPIKGNQAINSKYLFYWLKHPIFLNYVTEVSHGVNMPRLGTDAGRQAPIVLAPYQEQRRIADKLDTTLARVDALNDRLARITPLLQRFRQSVLAAATSGRLTEDWRCTNSLTTPWVSTEIQRVAKVGTGSTPLRSNPDFFAAEGTPWITSSATSQDLIKAADEYVTETAINAHRLKIYPVGTLLVAMYGEGKTRGQVSELGIAATINQACAAIFVDQQKINKNFLKLSLQANYLEMRVLAEGGNQPNLNLSKIKGFLVDLPSMKEQTEIVRRVETLFAFADRLQARLQSAQTAAERLTPALLAKAFRGELVPQDPNDEPATELLRRLREARAAQAPAKPQRGRKAATAKVAP